MNLLYAWRVCSWSGHICQGNVTDSEVPYKFLIWYYVVRDSRIMFDFIVTIDKHLPADGLCASP